MTDSHRNPPDPDAPPRHRRPTRRSVLEALGAGSVAALASGLLPYRPAEAAPATGSRQANTTSAPSATTKLEPFPLQDVRLLEGPFLAAQRRNEAYLLSLEADRLLHNFRVNAGLEPKAPVYGGWESQEPWVDIRCHGHTLGHYLSACSLTFAATGDEAFSRRVHYAVGELRACQQTAGTGLVCAFPDGDLQLRNSLQGKPFVGVPWYTLHKIFAGLHDAALYTGEPTALVVLTSLSNWAWEATRDLSEADMQALLDREHGGMNEVLADVYQLTGDEKYLALAERFCHRAVLDPLAAGQDTLNGLHANTQIPKVVGFNRLHQFTGRQPYADAAAFFWRTVVQRRAYATGGTSDVEHFFPPGEFPERLQSAKTMETCCTYNMLRLSRSLFQSEPLAAYADYYELGLYNGILASQDPESGMMTYFQATRPGYLKLYCTPTDSFWCCTGSGMENHAKYGDSIYFHDTESIFVNLYVPSTVRWQDAGVNLTQVTDFPATPSTRLTVETTQARRFALMIRHPGWCDAMSVRINDGEPHAYRESGGYVVLRRRWHDGDVVHVDLPMALHAVPLPAAEDIVAIRYGPLVLAGRLGTEGLYPGADILRNERTSGQILHLPREVPRWDLNPDDPQARIQPADEPLSFVASGIRGLPGTRLVPYHQIAHERYNLYWQLERA